MCPQREVSVPAHRGLCAHEEGSICPRRGGTVPEHGGEECRRRLGGGARCPQRAADPPLTVVFKPPQTTANHSKPQQTIVNHSKPSQTRRGLSTAWITRFLASDSSRSAFVSAPSCQKLGQAHLSVFSCSSSSPEVWWPVVGSFGSGIRLLRR